MAADTTTQITEITLIDRTGRHRVFTVAGHPVAALPETVDCKGAAASGTVRVEGEVVDARFIRTRVRDDQGRLVYVQRW